MKYLVILQHYTGKDGNPTAFREEESEIHEEELAICDTLQKAIKVKTLFMESDLYSGKLKDNHFRALYIKESE